MRLGCARGEHVFRAEFACEGSGLYRYGLRLRRNFAGHGAGRELAVLDGKEGCAVCAIEDEDVAQLRGLHDGGNLPAIAVDGDEGGR